MLRPVVVLLKRGPFESGARLTDAATRMFAFLSRLLDFVGNGYQLTHLTNVQLSIKTLEQSEWHLRFSWMMFSEWRYFKPLAAP